MFVLLRFVKNFLGIYAIVLTQFLPNSSKKTQLQCDESNNFRFLMFVYSVIRHENKHLAEKFQSNENRIT